MFDSLWVEKYRPKTLNELVLTKANRVSLLELEKRQEIPNLLFIGHAGIGKTSLAEIITNDILKCQYIYINASDENGIDTIRTKVTSFSQTKSLDGKLKVIILDEVDGLTMDAQRALRNTMEEYSSNTRFILTANYKHRVIPPLHSRTQSYDLSPPIENCVERVCYILKSENINVDSKDKPNLVKLIKCHFPDLRKTINEIQKSCVGGSLIIKTLSRHDEFIKKVLECTLTDSLSVRKYVIENEQLFNNDYPSLLTDLFNYIMDSNLESTVKKQSMLVVSEHLYRSAFVLDQEINFYSCCIQLEKSRAR